MALTSSKAVLEKRAVLAKQMKDLTDKISVEDRDFTADESKLFADLESDYKSLSARLEILQRSDVIQAEQKSPLAEDRRDVGRGDSAHKDKVPAVPIDHEKEARMGFEDFGQFAREVQRSGVTKTPSRQLLEAYERRAVQGMSEGVGSDGGFLVPSGFSTKIFERVYSPENLLSRCDMYTISGNSMTWPRNLESSRATGSRYGGVQAYWRAEGNAPSYTKPTFGKFTLNLHKLIALAAATDELLDDSSAALEQYLFRAFSDEITFTIHAAIMAGTGSGQPTGILGAPCTVSVSKETGQAAATVNAQNVVKMWSRLWAGCRQNAVWLINQDVEPQLNLMTLGIGTAGQVVYMPPGGLSGSPYATLMGRPVIATEFNETLGTAGDIVLADLSHYAVATKGGGPKTATSMHLFFDTDQMAFRVTYRIDGAPWWAAALTPFKGSATQSCFVKLATRA